MTPLARDILIRASVITLMHEALEVAVGKAKETVEFKKPSDGFSNLTPPEILNVRAQL
jgi:hypothetical protein